MSIQDDLIKHQIFLQRLSAHNAEQMRNHLKVASRTALSTLEKSGGVVTREDLKRLNIELSDNLAKMTEQQISVMTKNAVYEAQFTTKLLANQPTGFFGAVSKVFNKFLDLFRSNPDTTIPITTDTVSLAKMMLTSEGKSVTVETALTSFAETKAKEITQIIADANLQPDPLAYAVTKLDDINSGLYVAQTNTLAGTANTATAASVRTDVFEEAGIDKVIWVATLDSDVCPDCEALDGTVYGVGEVEGGQEHWNCRCVMVPVPNDVNYGKN